MIKLDIVNAVVTTDERQPHQSGASRRDRFRIAEEGPRPRPAHRTAPLRRLQRQAPQDRHWPQPAHRRRSQHPSRQSRPLQARQRTPRHRRSQALARRCLRHNLGPRILAKDDVSHLLELYRSAGNVISLRSEGSDCRRVVRTAFASGNLVLRISCIAGDSKSANVSLSGRAISTAHESGLAAEAFASRDFRRFVHNSTHHLSVLR